MLETPIVPAGTPISPGIGPLPSAQIESLYQSLRSPLREYLQRRLRSAEAAEDVLHDVFVKIHQHAGEVRRGDRLESWIWTIARNAVIDRQRRTHATEPLTDHAEIEDIQSPDSPEAQSISARGDASPLHRTVRLFLDCLPEPYREALVQADLEGHSQKDLAARLGISHSGLKSRVQRARRMMGDLLQQCCHLEFDRYGNIVDYAPRHGRCAGCHDSASIEASVAGAEHTVDSGTCVPNGERTKAGVSQKPGTPCADPCC